MMKSNDHFLQSVCVLAIPVALQSMLQSAFSMVDQIMIGQLGEIQVAGVGLAGKFASIYAVLISAIGAAAGIMISQYLGQENDRGVRQSFFANLLLSGGIAGIFTAVCILFPERIMGAYTRDAQTRQTAAEYLALISGTFVPMAGAALLSTLLRCRERPRLPLYASIAAALLMNTGLNYILIFGKLGLAPMGIKGAAIATVLSQCENLLLMLLMLPRALLARTENEPQRALLAQFHWRQYLSLLLPLLVCEAMWSLGENVYAAIYGHISTDASAAMTLTNPVQGIVIGALCGLSQAAGVIIGKRLGRGETEDAYWAAKRLLIYGLAGALMLSAAVMLLSGVYVKLYQVEETVKATVRQLLFAYALVVPFKVLNMILGGGILRSGGQTKYVMFIDGIGTWCCGVPLGLLSAFVLRLPVAWVYFLLSLEECLRFGFSMAVFRRKKWMRRLDAGAQPSGLP